MALDTSNAWYTERDKIAIVGASGTNSQSFSDPDAGATVRLHVTKLDEPFITGETGDGIGTTESPDTESPLNQTIDLKTGITNLLSNLSNIGKNISEKTE